MEYKSKEEISSILISKLDLSSKSSSEDQSSQPLINFNKKNKKKKEDKI